MTFDTGRNSVNLHDNCRYMAKLWRTERRILDREQSSVEML